MSEFSVRHAEPSDEDLLFRWRNEPWVVRGGATQRTVRKTEHSEWFETVLSRRDRELFLIEIGNSPMGMVRYDLGPDLEASISIFLLPEFWGKGYGTKAILATAPKLSARRRVKRFVASVLFENQRSHNFFQHLGFQKSEGTEQLGLCKYQLDCLEVSHSRPWINEADVIAAANVVRSRHLSQGPKVEELEAHWNEATTNRYSAAVGSGLGALRLALLALGTEPNQEVIIPGFSCVALINAVLSLGAIPVLADVEPDLWTISVSDVHAKITKRTKAIIAVHLFGAPAPLQALNAFGLPVVEDCSHGIGGNIQGKPYGNLGAISTTSFYATKMICAGEGGMVSSSNPRFIEQVKEARNYGDRPPDGRYLNDKMTDLEAALAMSQLRRISEVLNRRKQLAQRYLTLLKPLAEKELIVLPIAEEGRIWYRFVIRLKRHFAASASKRMSEAGIKAEQPVWDLRDCKYWPKGLLGSALGYDRALSLPLYPELSEFQQNLVCEMLSFALENAEPR